MINNDPAEQRSAEGTSRMHGSIATSSRQISLSLRASIFLSAVLLGGLSFSWLAQSYLSSPEGPAHANASAVDPRILDRNNVYFGNPRSFKNPAVVVRKKIYAAIPSYQRIQNEGVQQSDVRYHLLLEKTSKTFRRAVSKVSRTSGHDLLIEAGAITPPTKGEHPNLTAAVISVIQKP